MFARHPLEMSRVVRQVFDLDEQIQVAVTRIEVDSHDQVVHGAGCRLFGIGRKVDFEPVRLARLPLGHDQLRLDEGREHFQVARIFLGVILLKTIIRNRRAVIDEDGICAPTGIRPRIALVKRGKRAHPSDSFERSPQAAQVRDLLIPGDEHVSDGIRQVPEDAHHGTHHMIAGVLIRVDAVARVERGKVTCVKIRIPGCQVTRPQIEVFIQTQPRIPGRVVSIEGAPIVVALQVDWVAPVSSDPIQQRQHVAKTWCKG